MSAQKNPAISIARVMGMLLIVLCHTVAYYTFIPGSAFLGQIFGVGVHLFFFVSGYLYGGKMVGNLGKWYAQRLLTVSVPAVITSIIVMISLFIIGTKISASTVVVYLLNLEGILFLNSGVLNYFSEIVPLGHIWFTTIIMLCYLLVPLLQKVKTPSSNAGNIAWISTFLAIGTLVCFFTFTFANLTFFFLFSIAYFLGRMRFLDKVRGNFAIGYSVILLAVIGGRLLMRHYFDNTAVYTFYVGISNFVLGTWPVIFLAYVYRKLPKIINVIADWKPLKWFDKYSFYIYLTHGIFCAGELNIYKLLPLPLATVAFCVCTLIGAMILKWLCDFITKPLFARIRKQ